MVVIATALAFLTQTPARFATLLPSAGSPVSDIFPPEGTTVDSVLFPPESKVGFVGPTITGAEAAAVQTAAAYPGNLGPANQFPLIATNSHDDDGKASSKLDIAKHWGNLSPWYSVSSSDYGLPDANPLAPKGCSVTQVHLLYRHGARYPTKGESTSRFAKKIEKATQSDVKLLGELAFLADWTYKLGADLLTPFGRGQEFLLGLQYRQLYGHLLNNFTESGTLPVFRTESQDRMVKTAENFAAGFFGVPEYLNQVNIEILVEAPGVNNSGAPYYVCENAHISNRGGIGGGVAHEFAQEAFNETARRLNKLVVGLEFSADDVLAMLQLCSYETVALGYSAFCPLFTDEDFKNYEYYFDLSFYYNSGPGSPVSAAQGKGYLQEFVGRFTHEYPAAHSALNETFDNSSTYFPLDQSIYADATHEVVVLNTLVAFNLTSLFTGPPLDFHRDEGRNNFVASKLVPFGTHFTVQVLECGTRQPSKQIRFIVRKKK
ncbi:phosphoglycerate mutase-like protein [Xylaria sp. CBS 124048]|nr:phosphoglycerate mutase-like protein [Xylaria sp. CBS 124048]